MSFVDYLEYTGMLAVNCDQTIVRTISGTQSADMWPKSVDRYELKNMLLYHGRTSQVLHEEMVEWVLVAIQQCAAVSAHLRAYGEPLVHN